MADENEVSGVINLAVNFDEVEAARSITAGSESARKFIDGTLAELQQGAALFEVAGRNLGNSLGHGLEASLRAALLNAQADYQRTVTAIGQTASAPLASGRRPADNQLRGVPLSGSSGAYQIAGSDSKYKTLQQADLAALQQVTQGRLLEARSIQERVAELAGLGQGTKLRSRPNSLYGQQTGGTRGAYTLGGNNDQQFKSLSDLELAARRARIDALAGETRAITEATKVQTASQRSFSDGTFTGREGGRALPGAQWAPQISNPDPLGMQQLLNNLQKSFGKVGWGGFQPAQLDELRGSFANGMPANPRRSVGAVRSLASIADTAAADGTGSPETNAALNQFGQQLRLMIGPMQKAAQAADQQAKSVTTGTEATEQNTQAVKGNTEAAEAKRATGGAGGGGRKPPKRPAAAGAAGGGKDENDDGNDIFRPDGSKVGGDPGTNQMGAPKTSTGDSKYQEGRNARRGMMPGGMDKAGSSAMDHPGSSPLDYLFGGLSNTAKYIQYFGALSGAIAIFSGITKGIHDATQEALAFNQAAIELNTTLQGSKTNSAAAAQSFGDTAVQSGLAPSVGVGLGATGIRRLGAQNGDATGVGNAFTTQASHLSVLDSSGKPQDYANSLGSIAQNYGLGAQDLGKVTNAAFVGFEKFGASISETIKGVEALAPAAKAANVPLNDLVETVADLQAKTGKGGAQVAADLTKALNAMGTPETTKALQLANLSGSGNGYKDLQNLAGALQKLPQNAQGNGRREQILHAVGGKTSSVGVFLQDQGAISAAAGDAAANPGAADKAYQAQMTSVLNVAKQVGAEFLNLGKDFANSGALAAAALLLETLKPILTVADGIVRAFNDIPDPFHELIAGAAGLYALTRLIAQTSLGSRLAGVAADVTPTTGALLGGAGGRLSGASAGLFGPGLLGGWRNSQANTEATMRRNVQGELSGEEQPPLQQRPGFGGAAVRAGIGAGAIYAGVKSGDPVGGALSAGLGAAMIAGPLALPAGLAVGGLTLAVKELTTSAKEAKDAVDSAATANKSYADYVAQGRHSTDDTQAQITSLTADAKTQHGQAHQGIVGNIVDHFRHPAQGGPRTSDQYAAEDREDADNARIKTLTDELNAQKNALNSVNQGGTDFSSVFGAGTSAFSLQGSGQTGLSVLQANGLGSEARAAAFSQALNSVGPGNINAGTIGEVTANESAVASGVGTSVTNRTGVATTGSNAALAQAQQDYNQLAAGNPNDPRLSGMQEIISQLSNAADAAFNSRLKAVQGLVTSFRAVDDVFGKHTDTITSLQSQLAKDTASHGAGSDQAVADQTALNQELQGQIQDTAAATSASFQAGVDPRNNVESAAAQVQLATRSLQNSTAGSTAFFQAQGALRQAQVSYASAVAEAQAQNVLAGARPGSPTEQIQAQITANNIRIAALKAPLPPLAASSQAKGLALDQAAATSQDPQVQGANSAVKFVTGVTSVDYKAVGAGIAADLTTGIVGGDGGSSAAQAVDGPGWTGKPQDTITKVNGLLKQFGLSPADAGQVLDPTLLKQYQAALTTVQQGATGKGAPASTGSAALARAGTAIPGYDATTAAAIEQGKEAATAALAAQNAQLAYQQRQSDEQALEGRNSLGVAQAGSGPEATAYGSLVNANAQAAYVKKEDPTAYQNNPAYIAAQTAAVQATQALTAALRENTKNVALLSGDMTNPIFMAQQATNDAQNKLNDDIKAGYGTDVTNPDRVALQGSKNAQAKTTVDTNLQLAQTDFQLGTDARFAGEQGRMGLSQYLTYLDNLRANLLAVKNKTYDQQQTLNEVDEAIQSTTSQFSGQFNLGDIKIPTIYEARRSVATSNAGVGYASSQTVNIQINGGNTAQVVGVLKAQLGASAQATVSTGKKVI